jgi:hypothetical protein
MSVEFVLVPASFMSTGPLASRGILGALTRSLIGEPVPSCLVQTRMRNANLLGAALRDVRADVTVRDDQLLAHWQGFKAIFARGPDSIWQAHFIGAVDEQQARSIIADVDRAYGLRVQQTVVQRLRDRAATAGMSVESQTTDQEDNVTLVLNVGAGR